MIEKSLNCPEQTVGTNMDIKDAAIEGSDRKVERVIGK